MELRFTICSYQCSDIFDFDHNNFNKNLDWFRKRLGDICLKIIGGERPYGSRQKRNLPSFGEMEEMATKSVANKVEKHAANALICERLLRRTSSQTDVNESCTACQI